MKFSDPYMFYLVWAVFLLVCVIIYGSRKRGRILSKFALTDVFHSIIPEYSEKRRYVKGGLLILALVFIVIALAGPLVGFRWEKIEQKGVDIMICLDCSRSMLAEDIKPSRLERAKHEIIDLLRMMKSDRAGLVAFAGDAVLQCPLTMDYSAFNIFLNALNPDYLPVGGTNISGAIETALNGFEKNVNSDKAIILITDGENTSGKPFDAAKKAAEQGVKIFCIGVGSRDGAPVPDKNGGFKKDMQGRIIMSKVDDAGLKKIAAIAGGRYVRSVAGNMDLDIIYNQDIRKTMKKKTIESTRRKIWENRFQWFLFPGLILLFAELFIDERKKINKMIFFLLVFPMMLLFSSVNCHAGASSSVKKGIAFFSKGEYAKAEKNFIDAQLDRPELPDIYYDIGTAAYKKGDFKSALRNFKKALDTKNKELKIKARYNLANTEYRMGDFKKAVQDYEKVLKENPENKNARENLEFVKKKIKEKKKKQNSSNKNKKSKNSDKKQNKQGNNKTDKDKNKNKSDKQNQNQTQTQKQNQNPNQKQKQKQKLNQNQDRSRNQKNKEQDKNKPRNSSQDKENKKQGSKKSTNQKSALNKKQNKPGKNMNKSDDNKHRQKGRKGKKQAGINKSPLDRAQEMMLNRLQDKPGRAMIPAYGKTVIEKDW